MSILKRIKRVFMSDTELLKDLFGQTMTTIDDLDVSDIGIKQKAIDGVIVGFSNYKGVASCEDRRTLIVQYKVDKSKSR